MGVLGAILQSMRPLIILGIALGFFAVYYTHGTAGLWVVGKLVAFGIVMNFFVWLAFRRIWKRWMQRRKAAENKGGPD